MNQDVKIVSKEIKMQDYKGKTLLNITFDNCTFIDFDDIKIINCNIHNSIFKNSNDYLLALNKNKLTKCRTDFVSLLNKIVRSSSMDLIEEIQKVMDQDDKYKDLTLVTFKKNLE